MKRRNPVFTTSISEHALFIPQSSQLAGICGISLKNEEQRKAQGLMAEVSPCESTVPFPFRKGTSPLPAGENRDMFWIP
jgi:hypothetical protein